MIECHCTDTDPIVYVIMAFVALGVLWISAYFTDKKITAVHNRVCDLEARPVLLIKTKARTDDQTPS